MSARTHAAAAGLVALALCAVGVHAQAEPPAATGSAAAQRDDGAPAARAAVHGAVVVAIDDESAPAARALARALYREGALRPALDEAAARTLAGDPPAVDAPAAVKELDQVRRSIAHAEGEPIARRLLASLGAGADAALVVAVSTTAGHPTARVLRVAGARYAPLELGATVQRARDGAPASFDWPGATTAIGALLAPDAGGAPPGGGPVRPLAKADTATPPAREGTTATGERSLWSSPWFWGSLAGVAAIGVTVFVLAETNAGESDTLRLQGRLAP